MSNSNSIAVGDRVRIHLPGSWTNGRYGTVKELNVERDIWKGHLIHVPDTSVEYPNGCTTIISPNNLEKLP